MRTYSLAHLSDGTLLRDLAALVARDRASTTELQVDARRLYLPAGYPTMYAWCVGELNLAEEVALKRIRAARAARQFPAIFAAVADGRLHVSAVVQLAPYLTVETADDLLTASAHRSKSEIEELLAQRFPRPDLPTRLEAIGPPLSPIHSGNSLDLDPVKAALPAPIEPSAPGRIDLSAPARIEAPVPRPRVQPLAPERFGVQFTIEQSTRDLLRDVQSLLGHRVPAGDVAAVFHVALESLKRDLEKGKFAATDKPRPRQHCSSRNPRHIPADVKRAVWERDKGRCTFVSDTGRRCDAPGDLEFDHVDPVARGGAATVGRMRLLCRAHNQYEAERTFGAEFMRRKRRSAADGKGLQSN